MGFGISDLRSPGRIPERINKGSAYCLSSLVDPKKVLWPIHCSKKSNRVRSKGVDPIVYEKTLFDVPYPGFTFIEEVVTVPASVVLTMKKN